MEQCIKCEIYKSITQFRTYNNETYSSTCKSCYNELDKLRKKGETLIIKCEICKGEKHLKHFAKLKKFYKKKICQMCYPTFLTEQKNKWSSNECHRNINYRIKKSLAARLRSVLTKKDTTMNYIGCNINYLREWFEFNFTEDMSWSNYGKYWSIDHLIPVYKFDLTNEKEKLKCWNWSNMVPVLVKYNSLKKDIVLKDVENIVNRLEKFKEEGSTTKWFSGEFMLNNELAIEKINCCLDSS